MHIVATDVGDNDAMSFLLCDTCLVAVPDDRVDRVRQVFSDLDDDDDRVVAAGNMTEWRGLPTDVGVLTEPDHRGHGFAGRLVGTMVSSALPAAIVVRYRALTTNTASLAVARRLGFEAHGQNYRVRTADR